MPNKCLKCDKRASFNFQGLKGRLYCGTHKEEGMVNLNTRACLDCSKVPVFNYPGQMVGIYCVTHKREGMENIVNKKHCLKCKTLPRFNYPEEDIGIYCSEHKEEGMVNLLDRTCLDCSKLPVFNYPGERMGIYCSKHKEEGMQNVNVKRHCLKCQKIPHFNYPGERMGIYCSKHKEEGMENIVNKKHCLKCQKVPNFNYPGEKRGKYCTQHKEERMVDIKNKKCLVCPKLTCYNYPGERGGKYCAEHKEEGMVNIKHKKCISEHCNTQANKYYNNYCCYCFTNLFPEHPKTKTARLKNKEIAVKNYLYENGHSDFLHDKPIYLGDCNSTRRVDLYKYIGDKHILCVEVDENQHKKYDKQDEVHRYNELYKLGYHSIFIRYNPDKYRDRYEKVKQPFFTTRMKVLLETLEKWSKKIESRECEDELLYIDYLYYDGY